MSWEIAVVGSNGVRAEVLMELTTPIPKSDFEQKLRSRTPIPANVVAEEKRP
jgi:hypothetical protein